MGRDDFIKYPILSMPKMVITIHRNSLDNWASSQKLVVDVRVILNDLDVNLVK